MPTRTASRLSPLEEHGGSLHPCVDADVMVQVIAEVAAPRWAEWERITTPALVVYADGGMFTEQQKAEFAGRGTNTTGVDFTRASHEAHRDPFAQWVAPLRAFITAE